MSRLSKSKKPWKVSHIKGLNGFNYLAFIYSPPIPIEMTFFILSKGVISLFVEDKIYLGAKEKLFNKHCIIEHGSNNLSFNDIL